MSVYVQPGQPGSVVSYEARYDNWIGGQRVPPVKGQYFENPTPMTGQTFCERIIQEEGVALVPGGAFGDDRWVRLSYAVSEKDLSLALDRVLQFIRTLGG